jgi:alkylation response protein AidB-like acyl-CoA dehydrogenase
MVTGTVPGSETATATAEGIRQRVAALLAAHDPARTPKLDFLRARFDAGLAWVHFPPGLGGLGAPRDLQAVADRALAEAGAPSNDPNRIGIGLGMAAPTILAHGTDAQRRRFLRPLWTGEEVWCQLFSEPGAGSDLAGLATRAVPVAASADDDTVGNLVNDSVAYTVTDTAADDDTVDEDTVNTASDSVIEPAAADGGADWIVDGQKVWTSMAHQARWGILLARTDPHVPKHRGLTYFVCDMRAPGVEVRPLRQLTGEAEFNEVFLTGVRVPDSHRLGAVGEGWAVARTTLMNERVAIGGGSSPREGGMIGAVARAWRDRPELRTPSARDTLLRLWVEAEAARLTAARLRQSLVAGQPGPEGSAVKLAFARLNQEISGFELELLGEEGLRHDTWWSDTWSAERPTTVDFSGRTAGYRYLRAKGNSIEGGTSEILRNIIAERVLGLPAEIRVDTDVPWKDLAQ